MLCIEDAHEKCVFENFPPLGKNPVATLHLHVYMHNYIMFELERDKQKREGGEND